MGLKDEPLSEAERAAIAAAIADATDDDDGALIRIDGNELVLREVLKALRDLQDEVKAMTEPLEARIAAIEQKLRDRGL